MKAYKGFNSKLQCTPDEKCFQYEIGKEYEEDTAKLCSSGFHACKNPIEVFNYYPPSDSRYCEVEIDDISDEEKSDDSKICGKKIKIEAEIGVKGIVDAFIKCTFDKVDFKNKKGTNTGDCSAATNTGIGGVAIATGYDSKAKASKGSAIVVCERGEWNGNTYPLIDIKAAIVDGMVLKENTFYKLVGGEFVECE